MTIGAVALLTMTLHAQSFETASEAVRNMGVGWNLGNTLDACSGSKQGLESETYWGQPVTKPELMQMMKTAGFGAIRIPVTWYPHMDTNNKVDKSWMNRVHEVVDYVINQGLYCIVNVHHDTGDGNTQWLHASTAIYEAQKQRFESLWRQIAEEFRDYDQHLLFESYNEMLDKYNSWCFATFNRPSGYNAADAADAYAAINNYAQSFVNTIRATGGNNAYRNLVVNTYGACCGSGTWNAHLQDPLKEMKLPKDAVDGHLIFQVHCYPSVKNINNTKTEVNDMFSLLKTHLASKGAPVIIGEWGTANDGEDDYTVRRQNVLAYADYFVKKAKDYGSGTFWWMGISDGSARTLPAFSQPDLAAAILKAWYGSDYTPSLLTIDDYDIIYKVNYTGQWQELNICDHDISLSNYKAVRLELGEAPKDGSLSIKIYGETDGKEQYVGIGQAQDITVNFDRNVLGTKSRRITLQYSMTTNYSIMVNSAFLIKTDGTEDPMTLTPFWGCTAEAVATKKPSAVSTPVVTPQTDNVLYDLSGRRVTSSPRPGIYVRNNRVVVVK